MKHIGFVGHRTYMTTDQHFQLREWMKENRPCILHHAGHYGSEGEVHSLFADTPIELHPQLGHKYRSPIQNTTIHPERPVPHLYFDIVHSTETMLVVPEMDRNATKADWIWEIVRYALRANKPVHIFWPKGEVDHVQKLSEFRNLRTKKIS